MISIDPSDPQFLHPHHKLTVCSDHCSLRYTYKFIQIVGIPSV